MPRKISARKATRAPKADAFALQIDALVNDPHRGEFDEIARPAGAHFALFATEDGEEAIIDIYDVIGTWETNARTFRAALQSINASTLTIRINSPGGSVFDGFAMYNDLRDYARRKNATIRTEIVGVAASIASVLAMAGDEIAIVENGFLMIHNAWSAVVGNARDLRKTADTLDALDRQITATYARRTGETPKAIADMMGAETWIDSEKAIELNFATEIIDSVDASALALDVSKYANAPRVLVRPSRAKAKAKPAAVAAKAPQPDLSEALAACNRLLGVLQR